MRLFHTFPVRKAGIAFISVCVLAIAAISGGLIYRSFSHCVRGDCENGIGVRKFNDGSIYVGRFKDGKFDGLGLFESRHGSYEGFWIQGRKHGAGKFTYKDSATFTGEFFENQKQGQGIYTWSDGTKLSGKWIQGEPDGECTMILPGGEKLNGMYRRGTVYAGTGIYIYDNGERYIGQWKEGRREGRGTLLDAEGGVIYSGAWSADKQVKANGI